MSKFLNKNAKVFLLAYIIIIACIFVFACYYMTQYMHIHIYYKVDETALQGVVFEGGSNLKEGQTNYNLFKFFDYLQYVDMGYVGSFGELVTYESPYKDLINGQIQSLQEVMTNEGYSSVNQFVRDYTQTYKEISFPLLKDADGNSLAFLIYDFQMAMNSFNNKLIVFGVVSIILVALMFVMANHNRRIYYISNLVVGVAAPLAISVYSVILMLENMQLQAMFNKNSALFKLVSLLQDPTQPVNPNDPTKTITADDIMKDFSYVDKLTSNVNDTTFTVGTLIFGVVIVASIAVAVYSVYRYLNCAKRRNEIIERAVQNND